MTSEAPTSDAVAPRRWRPLESIERRVLGVLVEKAKTTPEAYPLSINALRTGCNQKNNRAPLMHLEESQVEEACEQLRKSGAVSQVQGSGRVDRYRHLAYEWLGVEKVELAVMAELLLRGSQTVGELRGRAARMEPIKDLSELQPTLDSLAAKGLIVFLTPPGRGSVVAHALYLNREMEKVRREAGSEQTASAAPTSPITSPVRTESTPTAGPTSDAGKLVEQLDSLHDDVATLKKELQAVRDEFTASAERLRHDLDQLNQQLGN